MIKYDEIHHDSSQQRYCVFQINDFRCYIVTGVADLKEVVGSCDQKSCEQVIIFFLVFFKDLHTLLNQNSNKTFGVCMLLSICSALRCIK